MDTTAVFLAAGISSRFFPFNDKHKVLVKIAGEEIIVHTIKAAKKTGINNIIIVVPNEKDFQNALGDGSRYGVKITYVIQEKAEGMGDAVLLAAKHIKSSFFLVNSNHVEFEELKKDIDTKKSDTGVVLLGRKSGGKHLGALKIEGDKVTEVVEKPSSSEGFSDLKVVGVYSLDLGFLDVLKGVKPEHYSFETALNEYAKMGMVKIVETEHEVLSLKYPWDLLNIKTYILSRLKKSISPKATISEHAIIEGDVVIEEGVTVLENATIKGPCYLGKDVYVGSNSLIRNGTSVEEGSVVGGYMEVKNSLIMSGSKTHSGHLEDSIVGKNSRIGALFTTANVRLDRGNITCLVKDEKVDTGLRELGAIVGSNAHIGARVSTMPGIIVGNNVNIGPSTTVMKNVDSDISYYTDFNEIIKKKNN